MSWKSNSFLRLLYAIYRAGYLDVVWSRLRGSRWQSWGLAACALLIWYASHRLKQAGALDEAIAIILNGERVQVVEPEPVRVDDLLPGEVDDGDSPGSE